MDPYEPGMIRPKPCHSALSRATAAGAAVLALLTLPAAAWKPGIDPANPDAVASRGFSVDPRSRNDVLAFWQAVYKASEGYEERVGWTGNYSGNPGTVSRAFITDVERRVNFFRALCGIPADVRFNTGSTVAIDDEDPHKPSASTLKSDAAQASALMLIRNYNFNTGADPAIDHNPASHLTGWSPAAWNANAKGNLAFGVYGPTAMTEYMVEELSTGSVTSYWNSLVGHRRWLLYPDATNFATGDQPGESVFRPPTNVCYIIQKPSERRFIAKPGFVPYPPAGYFPAVLNSRYWSLSRHGADFTKAKVVVTDQAGRSIPLENVRANNNYGDPALVWEVTGAAAVRETYADKPFNVKITGIEGKDVPSSLDYRVTLIHPERLTSDQRLTGPTVTGSTGAAYAFKRPSRAEAVRVTTYQRVPANWVEGAETTPAPRVVDLTCGAFPLVVTGTDLGFHGALAGARSFNLTFDSLFNLIARGIAEQSFELKHLILPGSGAKLNFTYCRGYMTPGSHLVVEATNDGGVSWKRIGSEITGVSNNHADTKLSTASFDLPASTQPVRLRFRYFATPLKPVYTHKDAPDSPTGIFIDQIRVTKSDCLVPGRSTKLAKGMKSFPFNASTAGRSLKPGQRWALALSTRLGGHWFPDGPLTEVTIAKP